MYQLLGPLSTSKENVLTSRCHVSQLFSQWAISTGEKSPKSYWGTFFYFHLKFWKVLIKPQLSFKEFLQNQSVKKKKFSPSLKVTHLTPPPSSTSSTNVERLFKRGLVATDHRSSLSGEKLDQILFLRENALMANFDLGWN